MKINFQFIHILLVCVFLFSCSSNIESAGIIVDSNTIYIEGFTKPELPQVKHLENIEYIPLEMKEGALLSSIDKFLVKNGLFYISDNRFNQVLIFKEDGTFIRQIGEIGRGPGEFLSVDDICFNGDSSSLFILSNSSMKVLEYNLKGDFKKDIPINHYASDLAVKSDNEMYFFINKNISQNSGKFNLLKCNIKGDVLDKYFPFTENDDPSISFSGFLSNGRNHQVFYSNSFRDTIYSVEENAIRARYIFNLKKTKPNLSNSDFNNDLQSREYLALPFIKMQNNILFSLFTEERLKTVITSLTPPYKKVSLPYPFSKTVGYNSKDESLYASFFLIEVENYKDMPFMKNVLKEYPEINKLVKMLPLDSNPVIIKYNL